MATRSGIVDQDVYRSDRVSDRRECRLNRPRVTGVAADEDGLAPLGTEFAGSSFPVLRLDVEPGDAGAGSGERGGGGPADSGAEAGDHGQPAGQGPRWHDRHESSPTTGLASSVTPSMLITTVSPGRRKRGGVRAAPIPDGVPVAMTSPGSNVIVWLR